MKGKARVSNYIVNRIFSVYDSCSQNREISFVELSDFQPHSLFTAKLNYANLLQKPIEQINLKYVVTKCKQCDEGKLKKKLNEMCKTLKTRYKLCRSIYLICDC